MHQSFLSFRGKRYLWWALALTVTAIGAYLWHEPLSNPNGGTWLGYTLGCTAAMLIVALTGLGVRKRRYRSNLGTVQGWVSAHVYLGLALLVVATLHTGFEFGLNVHTLAYVLMVVVILSGVAGVLLYRYVPELIAKNRAGLSQEQMLEALDALDERSVKLSARLPPEFRDAAVSNRDRTKLGGSVRAVLAGLDHSAVILPLPGGSADVRANPDQKALLEWLGAELDKHPTGERSHMIADLVAIIGKRRALLKRLRHDAQLRGWLQIWLYVHVPLSFGLIGALIAHVVSVFYYW
jgi:hypothetical protein